MKRRPSELVYAPEVEDPEQCMIIACQVQAEKGLAAARMRFMCIRRQMVPSVVVRWYGDPRLWKRVIFAD